MIKLGKTVILGDSYSTFAGYIPEGNVIYYSPEDAYGSRVTRVEQTWWHQLISATDSELVKNLSISAKRTEKKTSLSFVFLFLYSSPHAVSFFLAGAKKVTES